MIKVTLTYPNGAVFQTETVTLQELLNALAAQSDMPVFLVDKVKQGLIPIRIVGPTMDPALNVDAAVNPTLSFQIEAAVDLE